MVTVGGVDNFDPNPSSTTAQSSFHGTAISITQFSNPDSVGDSRLDIQFITGDLNTNISLPISYSTVPAISLDVSKTSVPEKCLSSSVSLERSVVKENAWLKHVMKLLDSDGEQQMSWSAFHVACEAPSTVLPANTAMLPLFREKADTPAMVKHAMNILISITSYLSPGQIPVMACDCPIFAKAKYIQWTWPSNHGEDKMVIMFGGLHLEMSMWNMLGDYLAEYGWTVAFSEAGIASSGVADVLLNVSHLTKTQHAHQITIAALYQLQREAYALSDESLTSTFDEWRQNMIEKSPTFQFWDTTLRIGKLVLTFVRAHRERNFDLYVQSLELIVEYYFALDHYNYARWVPIHICDMKSLPASFCEILKCTGL